MIEAELSTKINEVEVSLTSLINQTRSLLKSKINRVESGLNIRLESAENSVSGVNTNIENMRTDLRVFRNSTNKKFSDVWARFDKNEKAIGNLPETTSYQPTTTSYQPTTTSYQPTSYANPPAKNTGSTTYDYMRNYVILYSTVQVFYSITP
jgi:hypothetical protein